jgi:methyltransferase (TIGR00027 family)
MQNRTSRTAEHVALFRALESARHHDRVFTDPFAARFLPGNYRLVARAARIPAINRWVEHYIDGHYPAGPRGSAVARTRLIDDLTREALADGARQVVLLGAGFDSRAYRLPEMAQVTVFEVDHPATQKTKQRLLRGAVHPRKRAHVRLVPADLTADDLGATLRAAGFEVLERTVVVWEGVTNYLTANAVDATIRRLAEITGSGSRLIFTYVDRRALDGTGGFTGFDEWHASVRDVGEPWTFGFVPSELPVYLAEREMGLFLDLSAREAADRYLLPLGRHDPAAPFYRIAAAEIR